MSVPCIPDSADGNTYFSGRCPNFHHNLLILLETTLGRCVCPRATTTAPCSRGVWKLWMQGLGFRWFLFFTKNCYCGSLSFPLSFNTDMFFKKIVAVVTWTALNPWLSLGRIDLKNIESFNSHIHLNYLTISHQLSTIDWGFCGVFIASFKLLMLLKQYFNNFIS